MLLDDLCRDVLEDVATLRPCLLLETSPANYQAWLMLPDIPHHRDEAKSICRELAQRFRADLASADPDHVGRVPGFTNRKSKHKLGNGMFPFVKLHHWAHRPANFYPCGGAVFQTPDVPSGNEAVHRHAAGEGSISEQDFGVACGLVRMGKSDEEIAQHLLATSPDIATRKGRQTQSYLYRTIANARKVTPM